jgi:cellulose synthase/poly-beta-1,6-N-acetylglucosamine synthase-like glycosyltransferase
VVSACYTHGMNVGADGLLLCLFLALYFEVFLLISFFEKRPAAKSAALPRRFPTVTMLVPCFNEEATLKKTVESLLTLDYPAHLLDIHIVDDGSQDATPLIGQELAQAHPGRVRYSRKENGGKYTALNFGIERSTSELVGCLDADSFVMPDALMEMVKCFEGDPKIYAITPAMKVYRPATLLELMQAVEYTFGIFYKKMFDNISAINVLPGPFSMYRRDVFEKIGLFRHAHQTEDMEIAFRMHAHGLKIANAHTAVVLTTAPRTVRALVKQRTRWSQGFLQNSLDYAYMYFNPRFGHFGMLVLPFALAAFFAGLYTALYAFMRLALYAWSRWSDFIASGVPAHLPSVSHLSWYYLNTSMLTVLTLMMLVMTLVAILLGARIAKTKLGLQAFVAYFLLFGLVAPLWLIRALWGALRAREAAWR